MVTSRSVWLAMGDNTIAPKLLEPARAHSKLVLEHIEKDTCPERRQAIRAEIGRLKAERELLLASSFHQEVVK